MVKLRDRIRKFDNHRVEIEAVTEDGEWRAFFGIKKGLATGFMAQTRGRRGYKAFHEKGIPVELRNGQYGISVPPHGSAKDKTPRWFPIPDSPE